MPRHGNNKLNVPAENESNTTNAASGVFFFLRVEFLRDSTATPLGSSQLSAPTFAPRTLDAKRTTAKLQESTRKMSMELAHNLRSARLWNRCCRGCTHRDGSPIHRNEIKTLRANTRQEKRRRGYCVSCTRSSVRKLPRAPSVHHPPVRARAQSPLQPPVRPPAAAQRMRAPDSVLPARAESSSPNKNITKGPKFLQQGF